MKIIDIKEVKAKLSDPNYNVRLEFELMQGLSHPNIVKVHEIIESEIDGRPKLSVALELVAGYPLDSLSFWNAYNQKQQLSCSNRKLDKEYLMRYSGQLLSAINYCKHPYPNFLVHVIKKIAHRDIKPDNLLISKDLTKLYVCDFGVSEKFSLDTQDQDTLKISLVSDLTTKISGSPLFHPPEVYPISLGS